MNDCTHCWHGDGGAESEKYSVTYKLCCFCGDKVTEKYRKRTPPMEHHGAFIPRYGPIESKQLQTLMEMINATG